MRAGANSKSGEDRMVGGIAGTLAQKVILLSRGGGQEKQGGAKLRRDLLEAAHRAGFQSVTLSAIGWRHFLALARLRLPRRSIVIMPYPDLPAIRYGGFLKAIASLCEVSLLVFKKHWGRWKLLLYVYDLPIEQREAVGGPPTHPLARLAEAAAFRVSDAIGVFGLEMEGLIRHHHTHLTTPLVYYGFLPHYAPRFEKKSGPSYPRKVAFAGNLSKKRIEKLAQLLLVSPDIEYYFYGPDGEWLAGTREDFRWCGSFDAEELPAILNANADFGLLLYDTSSHAWLEYLHMTTTAKFYTYLCAGLPILSFSYRNIVKVIRFHGLGYVFDDPAHLASIVLGVDEKNYRQTASRVARFAHELASRNMLAEFVETALEATRRR